MSDDTYLRDELERAEELADHYRQKSEEAFQRQRDDIRQRIQRERREASTWPEAFAKQNILYREELRFAREYNDDTAFWEHLLSINRDAAALWAPVQAEIVALCAQRREEIARTLEETFGERARNLVDALRENDPSAYLNW